MKKISRRNSLIVTIPLAATAAAWVVILFLPIQKAIGRLQDEAQQMEDYCHRSELLLPVLQRTGRDLAEVRQRIGYWEETSPAPDELTSLLGEITAAAREAGIRTTRFDPSRWSCTIALPKCPCRSGWPARFLTCSRSSASWNPCRRPFGWTD